MIIHYSLGLLAAKVLLFLCPKWAESATVGLRGMGWGLQGVAQMPWRLRWV